MKTAGVGGPRSEVRTASASPCASPAPVRIALVRCYEYGGTYIARAKGTGERATCTSSAIDAVRRCGRKVAAKLGANGIGVTKFGRDLWEVWR